MTLGCMSSGLINLYTFSLMRWSWTCSAGVHFAGLFVGLIANLGVKARMSPQCKISAAPDSCRVDDSIHAPAML